MINRTCLVFDVIMMMRQSGGDHWSGARWVGFIPGFSDHNHWVQSAQSKTRMLRLVTHFRTHSSVSDDDVSEFCQFSHESLISWHLVMVRGKIIWILSIFAAERDRYNTLWLRLIFTQNKTRLIWSGCDKQLFLSIICSGLVSGV